MLFSLGLPPICLHLRHLPASRSRSLQLPPLASDGPNPKHPRQFRSLARLALSKCTRSSRLSLQRKTAQSGNSKHRSHHHHEFYNISRHHWTFLGVNSCKFRILPRTLSSTRQCYVSRLFESHPHVQKLCNSKFNSNRMISRQFSVKIKMLL